MPSLRADELDNLLLGNSSTQPSDEELISRLTASPEAPMSIEKSVTPSVEKLASPEMDDLDKYLSNKNDKYGKDAILLDNLTGSSIKEKSSLPNTPVESSTSILNQANPSVSVPSIPATSNESELANAYDAQKQTNLIAGLTKSLGGIGSALAGGGYHPLPTMDVSNIENIGKTEVEHVKAKQILKDTEIARELKQHQLKELKDGNDPSSERSKLFRANLIAAAPEYAKKLKAMLGKDFDLIAASDKDKTIDLLKLRESIDARKELASMKAEEHKLIRSSLEEKQNNADFGKLGEKLISEKASSRSAFGKAANNKSAAERIQTMVEGKNLNDLDSRQIAELARNLDTLLSQGSATVSGMKKLIPESAVGNLAKLEEYILNQRKGAQQGDFVTSMMETTERERQLATKQVRDTQQKVLAPYSHLKKRDPERYNDIMKVHGLGEESEKDPKVERFIKENPGFTYSSAEQIMKARGYGK